MFAALRIVDNKAILYFEAPTTSDALTWFRGTFPPILANRTQIENCRSQQSTYIYRRQHQKYDVRNQTSAPRRWLRRGCRETRRFSSLTSSSIHIVIIHSFITISYSSFSESKLIINAQCPFLCASALRCSSFPPFSHRYSRLYIYPAIR